MNEDVTRPHRAESHRCLLSIPRTADYREPTTPSGIRIAESPRRRPALNWFNLSILGWIIVIIALAIAAYMMHAPMIWIAIGALALLGIGIIASVGKSKPQV